MSNLPRKRRERTVFHYKVDEDLRPEDWDPYLTLIREPRTRIDDAHAWLRARGYKMSRSAVARHRRRRLAAERAGQADLDRARAFAVLAGSPGAPDFAKGAAAQLTYLAFEHLCRAEERLLNGPGAGAPLAADVDPAVASRVTSTDLLQLTKLVAACVELRRRQAEAEFAATRRAAPSTPRTSPKTNAEPRRTLDEILGNPALPHTSTSVHEDILDDPDPDRS